MAWGLGAESKELIKKLFLFSIVVQWEIVNTSTSFTIYRSGLPIKPHANRCTLLFREG